MPRNRTLWYLTAAFAAHALPLAARAQVGHDPAGSPYRSLRYTQFVGLTGGLFNGNGGDLGVAPHHGATLGLRFDFLAASTVTLGLVGTFASLERTIIDPNRPIETARVAQIRQRAAMVEAIVQFNLTGGKSWHRIAPFLSGGVGFVIAGNPEQDSSGFDFRNRFALTPGLGARVFLSERLFLRFDVRNAFWSVRYPSTFRSNPSTDPSKPPVLASPSKEWLANGWYQVGISYAFRRPF